MLAGCDETLYILLEHPHLRSADLRDGHAMPLLRRRVAHGNGTIIEIAETVGNLDTEALLQHAAKSCEVRRYTEEDDEAWQGAGLSVAQVPVVSKPKAPAAQRREVLKQTGQYPASS